MAYFAEFLRRHWYCICGFNMINEYKRFLYEEWYNSLTEEQKIRLEENRKRREEKREKELNTEIAKLAMMTGMISGIYAKFGKDKYHGVYDSFGFPRIQEKKIYEDNRLYIFEKH